MAETTVLQGFALAGFDIRQLEQELARRKRKFLIDAGNSEDAPIDLTEDDFPMADTPMNGINSSSETDVAVKVEPAVDDTEVAVKIEPTDDDTRVAVKTGASDEDAVKVKVEHGRDGEGEPTSKHPARPRKRARKEPPPAIYKARVTYLAQTGTATATSSNNVVNDDIMARIKKCLARYNHPATPENEAKVAFRMASRLMEQHNISQTEVSAKEGETGQKLRAGQSVVSLIRSDGDQTKEVKHFAYNDRIASAMGQFFDCDHYTVAKRSSLDFVFYGIVENTTTAALAFEMAYNLIAEWARSQKGVGPKNSYCLGASWQLQLTAREEKAAEEARAIQAEKDALAATVQQEQREDDARLARLQPTVEDDEVIVDELAVDANDHDDVAEDNADSGPAEDSTASTNSSGSSDSSDEPDFNGFGDYEGTEDEDDDVIEPDFVEDEQAVDMFGDLEEEIRQHIQPERVSRNATPEMESFPHPLSQRDSLMPGTQAGQQRDGTLPSQDEILELEKGLESSWASHMQLMTFRADATKVAEDYLNENDIKLRSDRKRSTVVRDRAAYVKGKEDGKKIDVRQKKIKEEPAWEDEVVVP